MHTTFAPLTRPVTIPAPACEHAWRTESRHPTSDGAIRYVRCVRCTARRVDAEPAAMPVALSRVIGESPAEAAEPV